MAHGELKHDTPSFSASCKVYQLIAGDTKDNSRDVWLNRWQPHGAWRAGNPIVKLTVIVLILIGTILKDHVIMVQASCLALLIVYLPSTKNSRIVNLFTNFGLGTLLIGSISIAIKLLGSVLPVYNLAGVAKLDTLTIFSFIIIAFGLFKFSNAFTSRDIAWMIDFLGAQKRGNVAAHVYSFMYGLLRWPSIINHIDNTVRSRGGDPVHRSFFWGRRATAVDAIGLRMSNMIKHLDEMTLNVQYVMHSRIRVDTRGSISGEHWSPADYGILGALFLVIIGKPIFDLLASLMGL